MSKTKQDDIDVHIGMRSECGPGGMLFIVGAEFTEFQQDYTSQDLRNAQAVLLDLADAIKLKLTHKAH